LTLEANGASRERYVVARIHAHAHCHTHPGWYVHRWFVIIVVIIVNGTSAVDDIAKL
jgi:hypothetical protein